jgi:RNA polymerase sigma-70 factor (ECF subfamily)
MQLCRHIDEEALDGDARNRVDPVAEAQLVERLKAGEEAAYELLLAHFQQPVYSLVQRLIDDASEASDVTQDVFLKVFRNIGSFRGQSSLKTWVYRISVNEAHNRRRWFGRHRRAEIELESEETGKSWLEHLSDHSKTPYELVLNLERRAAIERALAGMSPAFRDAVVLRDLEDLSYEEIADVLDISIGTVKSRILRGREAMRKALLDELEPSRGMQFAPQTVE